MQKFKKRNSKSGAQPIKIPGPKSDPIHIHTVFGNTILPGNSDVLVLNKGRAYVRKKACELTSGEKIIFKKEGLDITLEQVTDALSASPRYTSTYPILFSEKDGKYTTSFSMALFSGIADARDMWPNDLDPNDHLAMADAIKEHLAGHGIKVTREHIVYQWLAGQVIAPRDERVLPALVPMAPKLGPLMDEGFQRAYKTYVAIRQTVMRSISFSLSGKGSGRQSTRPGSTYSAEIDIITKHFHESLTSMVTAATVLSVRQHERSSSPNPIPHSNLFKGPLSESEDFRERPMIDIYTEHFLIRPLIQRICADYILAKEPDFLSSGDAKDFNLQIFHYFEVSKALGFADTEKSMAESMTLMDIIRSQGIPAPTRLDQAIRPSTSSRRLSSLLVKALQDGEIDGRYSLRLGRAISIFDQYARDTSAQPVEISWLRVLSSMEAAIPLQDPRVRPFLTAKIRAISKSVEDRMHARYGYRMLDFVRTHIHTPIEHLSSEAQPFLLHVLSGSMTAGEALVRSGSAPGKYDSSHRAKKKLAEIGYDDVAHLYPVIKI